MKSFTILTLGFLLGALAVAACSKQAPSVPSNSVDAATVATAAVASKAQDAKDAADKAATVVVTAAKVPVLAPSKVAPAKATKVRGKNAGAAERAAYARAVMSDLRAECLTRAVDMKAAYDVEKGKIEDWGNVRTQPVCAKYAVN